MKRYAVLREIPVDFIPSHGIRYKIKTTLFLSAEEMIRHKEQNPNADFTYIEYEELEFEKKVIFSVKKNKS